jgi:ribosomal protein S18 acetylase RimI-like enzyme
MLWTMSEQSRDAVEIPRERLDEAVAVLAAAFEPDQLMHYLFSEAEAPYRECLNELHRFACLVRLELGWPLIGIESEGELVGVLGVTMPGDDRWPDSLRQIYANLGKAVGAEAIRKLEAYSELADHGRPKEPHHHIGMVGVHPAQQGKGYGRTLIDTVQAMSKAHPVSIGVALDTENPANRSFYESCGYHVLEESHLDELSVWCMFRPNTGP